MRISDWSSDVCSSDLLGSGKAEVLAVEADAAAVGRIAVVVGVPGVRDLNVGEAGARAAREAPVAAHQITVGGAGLARKSVVEGKSVSVRVDRGGRRISKKEKQLELYRRSKEQC